MNEENDTIDALQKRIKSLEKQAGKSKDSWDKFQIVGSFSMPVIVLLVGWWLNNAVASAKDDVDDAISASNTSVNENIKLVDEAAAEAEERLGHQAVAMDVSNEAFRNAMAKTIDDLANNRRPIPIDTAYASELTKMNVDPSILESLKDPKRFVPPQKRESEIDLRKPLRMAN